MRTLAWLAILNCAIACGRGKRAKGPLKPHALPGFAISLPEGDVLDDKSEKYSAGTYDYGVKGSWVVAITWTPGALSERDRSSYQEAWKLELTKPLALTAPNVKTETFAGTNHGPARVSFVACGTRNLVIASVDHDDVDKLHRDILATFACTPDPAKEHASGARVTLAEPSGWLRIGEDAKLLVLERDNGNQMLLGLFYPTKPDQAVYDKLVSRYQGTVGEGDPRPVSAAAIRGWLRTLECGADNYVVAMYIEAGSGAADRTTIDGVRCLRADEPEPTWPAAPAALQQMMK